MRPISVLALFAMFVLLFAMIPAFLPRAQAQTGGSTTIYLNGQYTDDDECYALNSTVTDNTNVNGGEQCFRGIYTGSTETLASVTIVVNSIVEIDPSIYVQLYDLSADGVTLAESSESATIPAGGSDCDPVTTTITLDIYPGAKAISGHEFELDVSFEGTLVLGNGDCDPATFSQLDLGFQSTASTPSNPCEYNIECNTAFAAFDVVSATGAPVGGATVVVSATGYESQSATTTSTASTSLLCTFSPAWTAIWGAYWGCDIGTTGPFTLNSATTYSYTVTLPSGTVLTGSVGPGTTPGTSPWTVTLVTVAA